MKLWLLYIIICAISMSANPVLALNYQEDFVNSAQNWDITESQLSAAKLLQNYIETYRNKINQLHNTYEWPNSVAMSNFNFQTWNMQASLIDIQKNKYDTKTSSKIMSKIVSDLKIINTRMKVFLEQEKIIYLDSVRQKQQVLSWIWKQISDTLDDLLLSVSNQLITKNNLSTKEKKLVESLVVLREQNMKMKKFSNYEFTSHSEMNQYLKDVISAIRNEFKKIRTL